MTVKKWLPLAVVLVLSFAILIWFFGIGGLVAGIFETILLLVLTNPERAMGFLASLFTLGRNVHFWFERNAVEKRLESSIGLSSKKINEEGFELLPHGIDVKWVDPKSRDAFLKEDKIVVCLESSINEARNLARATMLYTSEDLIRESQRFVDKDVMKSACFAMARKMLMIDRRLHAVRCLNEEFIKPATDKSTNVAKYLLAMEKMDGDGFFTRILLPQFSELDSRFSPSLPSDVQAEAETVTFTKKLRDLVEKKKGIDVYPTHRGQVIRVSIMPIARSRTRPDPSLYVDWAKKCMNDQIPVLYVVARGYNILLAEWAIAEIETKKLYKKQYEWKYTTPFGRHGVESYVAVLSKV